MNQLVFMESKRFFFHSSSVSFQVPKREAVMVHYILHYMAVYLQGWVPDSFVEPVSFFLEEKNHLKSSFVIE